MALVDVPHGHTAGLLSFLECLPPATADAVYASTWTCAALVRALPPLAKHTVLRLVHVDAAVALGACFLHSAPRGWCKSFTDLLLSLWHARNAHVLSQATYGRGQDQK